MKSIIKWFALIGAALTLSGCGINNIPSYDEAVNATWAQVENQYKRRADLIPNLVETVKGYAAHEKDVLTQVIEARAKATQTTLPKDVLSNPEAFKQFEASQSQLSSALARLMVVVEKYPELKADKNFQQLQAQLEGTENRIAVARRDYIQAVQKYNTELRTFPGRLWAMTLYRNMKPRETFSAPEGAKEAPTVKF
ncbi:MAG: LemA family protein [Gammaproteobacteria bacterium]|nr:MAG: LemA family protein [Gammaproteobacteria bacterium]